MLNFGSLYGVKEAVEDEAVEDEEVEDEGVSNENFPEDEEDGLKLKVSGRGWSMNDNCFLEAVEDVKEYSAGTGRGGVRALNVNF